MGRWKAWALAWLLAVTLPALLASGTPAQDNELLVNGGFEEADADDQPVGWTAAGGEIEAVEALGRNGSWAGAFATDSSSYHYVGQCVPVSERSAYTFQGYALAPAETPIVSAFLLIRWYGGVECQGDELGASGETSEAVIVEPPGSWQRLVLEVGAAPATSRSARVGIVIEQSNATVYLDDFSFTGPPAPTATPTATPTPTPSPTPPPTQTPTPTASPSPSPSPEPTASPTPSPVASPSPTALPTATEVPSAATPSPSIPATAAVLVNGGFEQADDEGRPLGWRKYGGELRRSAAARRDGRFAAAFTSRTASTKWAFQTVVVEGSEAYVLSGYALKNDANVEAAYLRLSWYASPDGSGRAIDSVDSTARLTDDSPDFRFLTTGPVVAPTEAASAKVRLMLDPLSEAEGKVYFDAISFGQTTMPAQPEETPQPSPPSASSESPTASAVVPAAPVEELEPSSSPAALPPRPSPTVLGATPSSPEATAVSLGESSQSEAVPEGTPTRTPVVLYREVGAVQSNQGGEGVAAGSDESDGPSPIVLVLATASSAAAVAATAFFVWQRRRKRARLP